MILSQKLPKTFNLISIGQRGVGKTVFLAGSYAELNNCQTEELQEFWFDCLDQQADQNMEKLLKYIAQTGKYPPATMKITNLNFSLKRQNLRGTRELCHIRWWDIPGEFCHIRHREFQKLLLKSHGCCVFINADALVRDHAYHLMLDDVIRQVTGIASMVQQRGMKYPFALIFTKCDLLQLGPLSLLQIEENIQPLITGLNTAKANYKRFYSSIPIVVSTTGYSSLRAEGAADPLLWITSELRKLHRLQSQTDLSSGLMQKSSKSTDKVAATSRKVLRLKLSPNTYRYIMLWTVTSLSLLGVLATLFIAFFSLTSNPEQAQVPKQQLE